LSNVGSIAANFHEGSRSEYLANYLLTQFGTAISVPHQEDSGVDFHCTIMDRSGRLAWPRHHYTVQVKSTLKPWVFKSRKSVKWFVEHPFPLLLMVVDKSQARFRVYQTLPRFLVWTLAGPLPKRLTLIPEPDDKADPKPAAGLTRISLGPPIINLTVTELLKKNVAAQTKEILSSWLDIETRNLANVKNRLPLYVKPGKYVTNGPPGGGLAFQYSNLVEKLAEARPLFLGSLPWLKEYYRNRSDRLGMALTAMLLRHLDAAQTYGFPDPPLAEFDLSKALGMLPPRYVYEGVDKLTKELEAKLQKRTKKKPQRRTSKKLQKRTTK
jgi:hypothetical protein